MTKKRFKKSHAGSRRNRPWAPLKDLTKTPNWQTGRPAGTSRNLLTPTPWPSRMGAGPGWGPVRVGARSGLGSMWALMGPYGPMRALMDRSWQVRTCPILDFWSNFAHFGSQNGFLTKFINDSASFLLEKLKNHMILTKNHNI